MKSASTNKLSLNTSDGSNFEWDEAKFRNRLSIIILLLQRGADPNLSTYFETEEFPFASLAPVERWIWLAALRESGYSIEHDEAAGATRYVKSATPYTGKSILERNFVFCVECHCEEESDEEESDGPSIQHL